MLRQVVCGLLDLFWPPRTCCLLCDGPLQVEPGRNLLNAPTPICQNCWDAMGFRPGVIRCDICARPTADGRTLCVECEAGSPFGRVFALGLHEGALREAIHHLKFNGRPDLGPLLGHRLAPVVEQRPELLIPVPLHRSRLRERGYNQAALVAGGLSERLAVPVTGGLFRLRGTGHQAKLDRVSRLHNLDGAFGLIGTPNWVGKSVLLVDDVLTTGATAAAAAGVLRRSGAREVNLAVLAVSATPVRELISHEKSAYPEGTSLQHGEPPRGIR